MFRTRSILFPGRFENYEKSWGSGVREAANTLNILVFKRAEKICHLQMAHNLFANELQMNAGAQLPAIACDNGKCVCK